MVPRVILERPDLPRTEGGKLDRRALAAELAAAPAPAAGPGDGSVEATVAAAFAAALHLPSVSADDDFFSLGGHSLLAAQVATRLSGLLGREVGLIDLLERPTPAALSEAILAREAGDGGGRRIPRRPVAVGDTLPLAPIQQGLWFSSRITTAASYTVPVALELAGPLDVARLEAALRRLVELHTALRCAIVEVDGRPQGRLLPARVELAPRPVADEPRLLDELTRLAAEPIDLAAGPLRAVLLRLSAESHVLYLGIHHVACDGASVEHLLGQLLAEYEEPGSAAAPAIGFSDYAAWLDARAAETAADLAWWSEHLAGLPNLELPADRPRPAVIDHAGDHVLLRFDDELAAGLQAFARERRTTTFTVVLAGWLALVGTWAGQRDFCVGVPMSRRDHPDLTEVVGPVLTTLPVRAGLGGDPSFGEVVDRTHAELAACYGAAGVSFERIVEEVAGSRDPARTPLFQTLVSWEGRRDQAAAGDVMATPHVVGNSAAKTDLVLLLEETGDGLEGVIEYATALFDRATASQVAATLPRLLAAAVGDPAARLADLPRMPDRPARPAAPATGRQPAEAPPEPVAPRDDAERVLERILAAALSIDGLGVHDDFFALGGNSLSAIEATTYAKRVFQVDVPVTALFEAPTVAGLAETIRRLAPSGDHVERVAAIAVDMLLRDPDQAG
jgi:hypothetical protein